MKVLLITGDGCYDFSLKFAGQERHKTVVPIQFNQVIAVLVCRKRNFHCKPRCWVSITSESSTSLGYMARKPVVTADFVPIHGILLSFCSFDNAGKEINADLRPRKEVKLDFVLADPEKTLKSQLVDDWSRLTAIAWLQQCSNQVSFRKKGSKILGATEEDGVCCKNHWEHNQVKRKNLGCEWCWRRGRCDCWRIGFWLKQEMRLDMGFKPSQPYQSSLH